MPSAIPLDTAADIAHTDSASSRDHTLEHETAIPWYAVAMALGVTSIMIGLIWDIAWHRTIGRDTFWTPAHMAIYLGGVLSGCGGGWLACMATFGKDPRIRATAVDFWGMRAPLGAWVTLWGSLAMLTSAPFDDWWHNAYGLDVKIVSPPHMVLAAGIFALTQGALLIALALQNRASPRTRRARGLAYLYVGGLMVTTFGILTMEYTRPNSQHGTAFYVACALVFSPTLVALARASRVRWPATIAASIYLFYFLSTMWILPLFEGQPLLGPIHNPIDYFAPHSFPVLLIIPALAIDLLMRSWQGRWGNSRDHLLSLLLGTTFFALLIVVHWPFSEFLISTRADNWFFAGDRSWSFWTRPGPWQHRFWGPMIDLQGVLLAWGIAVLGSRFGLRWGGWMSRVQR